MNKLITNDKAFTLTEILIVVIIVSVIAQFAIPSYKAAIYRMKVRKAELNLNLMRGAIHILNVKRGDFPPYDGSDTDSWDNINEINANLKLNIIPDPGAEYRCAFDKPPFPWVRWYCQIYPVKADYPTCKYHVHSDDTWHKEYDPPHVGNGAVTCPY